MTRVLSRTAAAAALSVLGFSALPATLALAVGPANDDIASATLLTTSPVDGSNNSATNDLPNDVPKYGFDYGGASVWYKLSPPGVGQLTVSGVSANTTYDAQLAVYSSSGDASDTSAITQVGSTAGGSEQGERFGTVATTATGPVVVQTLAGLTYYVVVDGVRGNNTNAPTGSFRFTYAFAAAPANDNFANAATFTTTTGSPSTNASGDTTGATRETNEPIMCGTEYDGSTGFCNSGLHSVWYKWTAPAAGEVTVDTHTSSFDTVIAVYTGSSLPTLTAVNSGNGISDDTSVTDTTSEVKFTAVASQTYRIAIDGKDDGLGGAASGPYTVHLAEVVAPANDNFANATVISGATGHTDGTNLGSSVQTNEPEPHAYSFCNYNNGSGNSPAGKTVWYKWTAPAGGTYSFDTLANPNFNTALAVYTGSAVTNLTELACNDDYSPSTIQSRLNLNATGGQIYYIQVDGANDGTNPIAGTFRLNWQQPPANDNFANALTLTGETGNTAATNFGASVEYQEPQNASVLGGASVWWNWTAPSNGQYYFKTKNSGFNTTLGIYTGSAVGSLTTKGGNDDVSGGDNTSYATFTATGGTLYRISVDGFQGATGSIVLAWGLVPPTNDDFVNATGITGPSGSASGTNVGATTETGEPAFLSGNRSVWWTWTAPGTSSYTFNTEGSSFNTRLAVFTGSSVNALSPVASNDDVSGADNKSKVTFSGVSGTVYHIAVDGTGGATGSVALGWSVPPPDTTPPTITGLTPANGAFVRGSSVAVTGDATDDSGIASMTFTVDNGAVIAPVTDTTAPYGMTFDSTLLADGAHTISATATDSSTNANQTPSATVHTFTVDNTAPTTPTFTKALPPFTLGSSVTVTFTGTDATSGVNTYQVQYEKASYNGGFGAWTTPPGGGALTVKSYKLAAIVVGIDYCFRVISTDKAGNVSAPSALNCTARPVDDKTAVHSKGWTQGKGGTFLNGSFSKTTKKGATLTLGGFSGDRIALLALTCPTCGAVKIYLGTKLLGTISLKSSAKKDALFLLPKFATKTGTIKIVTTSTKSVTIDGIGASRT
jgi:hypothetical protein